MIPRVMTLALVLLVVPASAVAQEDPSWTCWNIFTTPMSHTDAATVGLLVTKPDGQHVNWGQDSCYDSHTKVSVDEQVAFALEGSPQGSTNGSDVASLQGFRPVGLAPFLRRLPIVGPAEFPAVRPILCAPHRRAREVCERAISIIASK